MKWPSSCQARIVSTAPGYGSAASTLASRWVSSTQTLDLLGPQPVISHVSCSRRAARRRSGAWRSPRAGPSSGAASSRCRSRCARRWYGRAPCRASIRMPSPGPAAASSAPARTPRTPTATTARGCTVDWPAMTRRLEVDGRSVNVIDTGGDGPPLLFLHGLGGLWQNWLLNIPAFMGTHRCVARRPAGLRRCPRCRRARSRSRASRGWSTRSATSSGSRSRSWSATRWAASSAPSWRSRSRRACRKLVLVSAAGLSAENLCARAAAGRRARLHGR